MTMDILNESTKSNPSALHGLYTDFDGWVINFEKITKERSTYYIKEPKSEVLDTAQNKTIDKNSVAGLLHLHEYLDRGILTKTTISDIWSAILNVNDSNNFVNFDYVVLRLVKDSFLLQYTKSKL